MKLTRTQMYKIPPHIADENKIVPNLNKRSEQQISALFLMELLFFLLILDHVSQCESHALEF